MDADELILPFVSRLLEGKKVGKKILGGGLNPLARADGLHLVGDLREVDCVSGPNFHILLCEPLRFFLT